MKLIQLIGNMLGVLGGTTIIAVCVWVAIQGRAKHDEREARQNKYLGTHKCVTVSYAGKDALPVYQCDNGLVMRKQIP